MTGLNTKDIKTGGGVPKILQPGNALCSINGFALTDFTFKPGGLNLILNLEGVDLGKDFEGFFIDKNNETLGRHKGQVGQVKASEWAYADGETKTGIPISRDGEMMKFLKNICLAFDCVNWLDAQDGKHATIQSLFAAFNTDLPCGNKKIEFCICGKEYTNKAGYIQYELFLPKFSKTHVPFGKTKVITFNEAEHIRKKKVEPVTEFGGDANVDNGIQASNEDFSID